MEGFTTPKSGQLKTDNHIMNGLWIGERLSYLEMLTVHSFVAHGHQFHLWTYGALDNELPYGVELKDANRIIPQEGVFRYRKTNQFGHGKGSVSGFSDIFRYKLLHDEGGWWVDMDITCLRPFTTDSEYLFRSHHELSVVGNVMKCPKGSELMRLCYDQAIQEVNADNTDWHKPIEILNRNIEFLDLGQFIHGGMGPSDRWDEVAAFLFGADALPSDFHFIHWMNEEWRSRGLDKDDFRIDSAYGKMLIEHGLVSDHFTTFNQWKNKLRFQLKKWAQGMR